MTRLLRLAVIVVGGLLFGGGAMLVVQGGRGLAGSQDGGPATTGSAITASPGTGTPTTTPPATTVPAPAVLLAWTPGGLPGGFAQSVDALPGTHRTTVVRGNLVHLTGAVDATGRAVGPVSPAGLVVPLDAIAIDTSTYPAFVSASDRRALRTLGPNDAVLGETSARLRGLDIGGHLALTDGSRLTVTAIVDDQAVGAAELVVALSTGGAIGVTTERYLLAEATGRAEDTATQIRAIADPSVPLRVRQTGETPYLRSSDAVLPQARIKDVFGEFSYRSPVGGREFRQDPAWVDAHIVTAEVPVLGEVRCNRGLIPALTGALQELADRNLAGLIQSHDGCYNPRLISTGGNLSRHAWGAAIDLNFSGNRTGTASIQDPRLVEVMARWGLASGDGWLVPDPGHFEYIGPPRG